MPKLGIRLGCANKLKYLIIFDVNWFSGKSFIVWAEVDVKKSKFDKDHHISNLLVLGIKNCTFLPTLWKLRKTEFKFKLLKSSKKILYGVHNSNEKNCILENDCGQACLDGRNKKRWQEKQTSTIRTTCPAPQQIEYSIYQVVKFWQNETVTLTTNQNLTYFVPCYAILPNHSHPP